MQPSGENINALPPGYRLERLTKASCIHLTQLYQQVHGKAVDADYFFRKYNTAFTGLSFMGFLVYDSTDRPIAFNGLLPTFIEYNGERILAAQNTDIMTDPAHRLKGMFVYLSRCLFELAKDNNIPLLFGFPNQQSYHGTVNRLHWKMTEHLSMFRITVKPVQWVKLLRKIKPLKGIYRIYRQRIISRYRIKEMGVHTAAKQEGFAVIDRSPGYLSWKQYNNSWVIHAGAATIWLSDRYYLMIGDIAGMEEGNFEAVLKQLITLAARLGIQEVQFHTAPGTNLHALWQKNTVREQSYPVLFQDFGSSIPPEKIKFSFADIDIF